MGLRLFLGFENVEPVSLRSEDEEACRAEVDPTLLSSSSMSVDLLVVFLLVLWGEAKSAVDILLKLPEDSVVSGLVCFRKEGLLTDREADLGEGTYPSVSSSGLVSSKLFISSNSLLLL